MNNKILAKAPDKEGYLFWERSRWDFNNPDGDLDDAYNELSKLLESLVQDVFDNYRASLIVRMHDDDGISYQLYCPYDSDHGAYLVAEWDWLETQDKMYLDWVAIFGDLVEEINEIIMEDDIHETS